MNLPVNARHAGLIPGLGTSPGEENDNPPQYSCLENPMDRGAWQAAVHGVAESQTQLKRLSMQPLIQGLHDLAPWSSFSTFPPKIHCVHTGYSLSELQKNHSYTLNFPISVNFPPRLGFTFSVSPVLLQNHPSQASSIVTSFAYLSPNPLTGSALFPDIS